MLVLGWIFLLIAFCDAIYAAAAAVVAAPAFNLAARKAAVSMNGRLFSRQRERWNLFLSCVVFAG